MIDENLNIQNTWFGGVLVVEKQKITSVLEEQLSHHRYIYPKKAYKTVKIPKNYKLLPSIPKIENFKINVIRTKLQGIITFHEKIDISNKNRLNKNFTNVAFKPDNAFNFLTIENREQARLAPLLCSQLQFENVTGVNRAQEA